MHQYGTFSKSIIVNTPARSLNSWLERIRLTVGRIGFDSLVDSDHNT